MGLNDRATISVPPSPGAGGNRRPSAAVLGAKNADAKHRLRSAASWGGVNTEVQVQMSGIHPTPPAFAALRLLGRATLPLQGRVAPSLPAEHVKHDSRYAE